MVEINRQRLWRVKSILIEIGNKYQQPWDEVDRATEIVDKVMDDLWLSSRPLVYVASPYTHPLAEVRQARFEAVARATGLLMANGVNAYSPIAHNHPVAEKWSLPKGWDFWKKVDTVYLELSHKLVVLKLPGWEESVGLEAEVDMALSMGIEVVCMEPVVCPVCASEPLDICERGCLANEADLLQSVAVPT